MSSIKGMDQLRKKLRKIKGLSENTDALLAGAYVIEKGSKKRAPVDTGFLRASGLSRKTDDGAQVVFEANYAYYQEFGTSKMPAHPFIRPTIDEDSNAIVRAVVSQLKEEIKKLGG